MAGNNVLNILNVLSYVNKKHALIMCFTIFRCITNLIDLFAPKTYTEHYIDGFLMAFINTNIT